MSYSDGRASSSRGSGNSRNSNGRNHVTPIHIHHSHIPTMPSLLQNLRKSFESARPTLRLLIQRKGESWEEKYGYGTDSDRRRKGLSALIPVQKAPRRNYSISNPEDFRQ
ncbi:hypothetical protein TELCIR_24448, partial [Teladorsagia circumcincta]